VLLLAGKSFGLAVNVVKGIILDVDTISCVIIYVVGVRSYIT
jgi:hypothetical protein